MTKKDFQFIADVLNTAMNELSDDQQRTVKALAFRFSGKLATQNPRFKSHMFLKASGVSNVAISVASAQ